MLSAIPKTNNEYHLADSVQKKIVKEHLFFGQHYQGQKTNMSL